MSLASPKPIAVKLPFELFRKYQAPFEGRQTARSALPSPSKSPIRGLSPFEPNCAAENALFMLLNRYQTPFDGRKTFMSALPSPSKSAGIGISPFEPNWVVQY